MTRPAHHSVTSLFSNLVTRPTGRAIRMGVESQIAELQGVPPVACVSVLDFSQVRVLDYSCADEIVAKLLLRYRDAAREAEVYFVVRGLQDHHQEAIEAVLERHGLLAVSEDATGAHHLLGVSDPVLARCWGALLARGPASLPEIAFAAGVSPTRTAHAVAAFCASRVAFREAEDSFVALPTLLSS